MTFQRGLDDRTLTRFSNNFTSAPNVASPSSHPGWVNQSNNARQSIGWKSKHMSMWRGNMREDASVSELAD